MILHKIAHMKEGIRTDLISSAIGWFLITGDLKKAVMEIRTDMPYPQPIIVVPDASIL
jgi:hypothetical protein